MVNTDRLNTTLAQLYPSGTPVPVAVLSSTVLTDGVFACHTVDFPASLAGVPHYVGHPATKVLLEALGAEQAPSRLFTGLEVGESYLAVPLAQNERPDGMTRDTAISDAIALHAKMVTRLA